MLGLESSVRSRINFVQFSSHNLRPKGNPNEAFTFLSPMETSENILIVVFARSTPGIDDCVTV